MYMQAQPENDPRIPASAPTLGYKMAIKKGPVMIIRFIMRFIFWDLASCLPVKSIRICCLWHATMSAITEERDMKRQVRTTQAVMSVAGSMYRQLSVIV